ncbi:conjugal transfer protein TraM [Legionella quinlivanii]|uniref:conjugal transfer protein TraM n=1 Tax=Legionella quinlivanii TaxID=45073 RepID=UPI002243FC33|nr:conjugal transfer protein TraM [Legionella quinlivanii]MCW8451798.1 conjugal transfer protein TraM [Legionella quinlivanii]
MSDLFDEAIQHIAGKHGVLLSKDDPILILQTMNERLLAKNRQEQALMLAQFREEMENISFQWGNEAKEKADKILNASLAKSKEVFAKRLQEATNESIHDIKKMLYGSLNEISKLKIQTRNYCQFLMISSTTILILTILFALIVF